MGATVPCTRSQASAARSLALFHPVLFIFLTGTVIPSLLRRTKTYTGCIPRASSITDLAIRFRTTNLSSLFFTFSPGITKTEVPNSGIFFSHSHLKLHTSSWRLPVFALYRAIRSRWSRQLPKQELFLHNRERMRF